MACRLPVIAYDQPVYSEVFGNVIIGVKIGDIKEMAKKICDVLKNYPKYEHISREGMQIASRFDWNAVATHELLKIKEII